MSKLQLIINHYWCHILTPVCWRRPCINQCSNTQLSHQLSFEFWICHLRADYFKYINNKNWYILQIRYYYSLERNKSLHVLTLLVFRLLSFNHPVKPFSLWIFLNSCIQFRSKINHAPLKTHRIWKLSQSNRFPVRTQKFFISHKLPKYDKMTNGIRNDYRQNIIYYTTCNGW